MTALTAAVVLFVLLFALEWLFWLSPLKPAVHRLTQLMGSWFYVAPPHYIARLLVFLAVLWIWKPDLWPIFAGGSNWYYSLVQGLVLMLLTYMFAAKIGLLDRHTFWWRAQTWYQEDPVPLARHTCYLVVYPGFVEELLFRWFFVASLWPSLGWWTLVVSPMLNIAWHLPVWIDMVRSQGAGTEKWQAALVGMVVPATAFAVLLTISAATTHNLAGAVMAHAFGDWCGVVQRRLTSRRLPQ